jgi:hypothetical protein
VRSIFDKRYSGNWSDNAVRELALEVTQLVGHTKDASDGQRLRDAARELDSSASDVAEMDYHLRRARYSPRERARVEEIARNWANFSQDMDQTLARLGVSSTIEHEDCRQQLRQLREFVENLVDDYEALLKKLRARAHTVNTEAGTKVAAVLKEYRRPAEVILKFAWNQHHLLLKSLAHICELSRRLRIRLDQMPEGTLSTQDSGVAIHKFIVKLKAEILKLSRIRSWTERNSVSLRDPEAPSDVRKNTGE